MDLCKSVRELVEKAPASPLSETLKTLVDVYCPVEAPQVEAPEMEAADISLEELHLPEAAPATVESDA